MSFQVILCLNAKNYIFKCFDRGHVLSLLGLKLQSIRQY
jgi:hypothetical protein